MIPEIWIMDMDTLGLQLPKKQLNHTQTHTITSENTYLQKTNFKQQILNLYKEKQKSTASQFAKPSLWDVVTT